MKTTKMLTILVLVLGLVSGAWAELVAHYEFQGNANDSSGNALHGTLAGGATIIADAERGNVLSLDGNGDYVTIPKIADSVELTYALWVNQNVIGSDLRALIAHQGWEYGSVHLDLRDGHPKVGINAAIQPAGDLDAGDYTLPVGEWRHVALIKSSALLAIYVDGQLAAQRALTVSDTVTLGEGFLGAWVNPGWGQTRYFNGLIDDVRIYDNALSEQQVLQLYQWRPPQEVKGFTYQGRLLDNNVAADGLYDVEFKLFDDAQTGKQVGNTIRIDELDVIDGYFTVALDFPSDPDIFNGDDRWLQISVRPGNSTGSFTALSPRQKITPTPYAIYAETAGTALSGPGGGGADNDWTISGSDVYRLSGNVGIGTSSPTAKLDVNGQMRVRGGSPGAGKVLTSDGAGLASWQTPTDGGGDDDLGNHTATQNIKLNGHYLSGDGGNEGVYVTPGGTVGIGTENATQLLHVYGASNPRILVEAPSNATPELNLKRGNNTYSLFMGSGNDLHFFKEGTKVTFTDHGNVGIWTHSPTQLLHVYGSSNPRILVEAPSNSTPELNLKRGTNSYNLFMGSGNDLHFFKDGTKVTFTDEGRVGIGTTDPSHELDVEGQIRASGSILTLSKLIVNKGLAAYKPGGLAGYFHGNVEISGKLTKGSGSFKIDHPLDPQNKYLKHSFVESPDMMNIYNGNITLDEKGQAVVQLPDYFAALNCDFRYQLTCIGGFAPVYIAEKISENRFKIAGGKAGMEVSWQVTGIRHDPYAVANRIQVEEDKPAEERGYYLHPAAYGLPEEKGIETARNPRPSQTQEVAKKELSYESNKHYN